MRAPFGRGTAAVSMQPGGCTGLSQHPRVAVEGAHASLSLPSSSKAVWLVQCLAGSSAPLTGPAPGPSASSGSVGSGRRSRYQVQRFQELKRPRRCLAAWLWKGSAPSSPSLITLLLHAVMTKLPCCVRQVEAILCINALIVNEENPVWEEHTLTM